MCEFLLSALDLSPEEKIIAIRENKHADASFILASLMFKFIAEDKNICLVTLHNTFSHYQNIGRRFGYDLSKQINENRLTLIDPLNDIVHDLFNNDATRNNNKYYGVDAKTIARQLFTEINNQTRRLLSINGGKHCCVIIDDLSHLLDLGLDLKLTSNFVQHLVDLCANTAGASIVVNCHASSSSVVDDVLANLLFYAADLQVVVSALKTGRSRNVSGVLCVKKRCCEFDSTKCETYHYKLMEKEIRVFAPGRALI